MTIEWVCKHHSDLGKEELYALLKLRSEVFVVEQKCAYPDLDGQDLGGDTHHLMGWEGDQLMAYLRLLDPESQGGDVVIGRVIIAPQGRGNEDIDRLIQSGILVAARTCDEERRCDRQILDCLSRRRVDESPPGGACRDSRTAVDVEHEAPQQRRGTNRDRARINQ